MRQDESPEERGDRLRRMSGVEDLGPVRLIMYRTWWISAIFTAVLAWFAVSEYVAERDLADAGFPGFLAVVWGLASIHQFRAWLAEHRATAL